MRLKSDGTPWRPIIHIEDISRAAALALEAPRELVAGQAFNVVSTAENYQIRDLARIAADAVPGSEVEMADGASPDVRNYQVNGDRIAEVLGLRGHVGRAARRRAARERLPGGRADDGGGRGAPVPADRADPPAARRRFARRRPRFRAGAVAEP